MSKVEICCGSYDDAVKAYEAGAKRVELNSDLSAGGLTPSIASLIQLKKEYPFSLEVIAMDRLRPAGFNYSENEMKILQLDARLLMANGADGIAFGFLHDDFTVDKENTIKIVELCHLFEKPAVFHRAFDVTEDPYKACEDLIKCGVDRILTSGLSRTALKGLDLIKELQKRYGDKIEFVAASGINENNAKEILDSGVSCIHASCRGLSKDVTTKHNDVSYSYIDDSYCFETVDADKVKALLKAAGEYE